MSNELRIALGFTTHWNPPLLQLDVLLGDVLLVRMTKIKQPDGPTLWGSEHGTSYGLLHDNQYWTDPAHGAQALLSKWAKRVLAEQSPHASL